MTDKNFTDFGAEDKYTNDKPFTTHVQEQQIDHILVTEFYFKTKTEKTLPGYN